MIFKWLETLRTRRREAQRREAESIRATLARMDAELKARLAADTDKMLATYCAVRGDNCVVTCTHFKAGHAKAWHLPNSDYFPEFNHNYRQPACKLWGTQ